MIILLYCVCKMCCTLQVVVLSDPRDCSLLWHSFQSVTYDFNGSIPEPKIALGQDSSWRKLPRAWVRQSPSLFSTTGLQAILALKFRHLYASASGGKKKKKKKKEPKKNKKKEKNPTSLYWRGWGPGPGTCCAPAGDPLVHFQDCGSHFLTPAGELNTHLHVNVSPPPLPKRSLQCSDPPPPLVHTHHLWYCCSTPHADMSVKGPPRDPFTTLPLGPLLLGVGRKKGRPLCSYSQRHFACS